jgi:hypothetical protein
MVESAKLFDIIIRALLEIDGMEWSHSFGLDGCGFESAVMQYRLKAGGGGLTGSANLSSKY